MMKLIRPARYQVPFAAMSNLALLVCVFFALSISIWAQDFRTVKDGVEYAEVTKEISGLKVNMNLLRLDLTKVRLDVAHAMDSAIGTEKTSSIAMRHGAFAAINAGFFRLDDSIFAGDPDGVLMLDGAFTGESKDDRVAALIVNGTTATSISVERLRLGEEISIGNKRFEIGVNRERQDNDIVLYSPLFHPTTLTTNDGVEVIIRGQTVVSVINGRGSTPIPADGSVLSASGKMRNELLSVAKPGVKVRATLIRDSPEQVSVIHDLLPNEFIVGGVPQLIKNGKIDITWQEEKSSRSFVETRHPRTAIAKLKDGKLLMITVDGRSESSGGIGLQDLAEYLLSLGAVDAMNLDGGGSTTMFLDGKVVNHPSDKEGERKVGNAIIVTPRAKGRPNH